MIRIGNKSDTLQQLDVIYKQAGVTTQNYLKFCPNIAKIEKDIQSHTPTPQAATSTSGTTVKIPTTTTTTQPSPAPQQAASNEIGFTIKDIKLGQEYDGYIKLSYNYGMFVTVK